MANSRIDQTASPAGNMDGADPFAKLLGFNTYKDRMGGLQRQLAAAQALRDKPRRKYETWAGALAGGAGDVMDSVNSKMQEDRLRGEEKELIGSEDARTKELLALPGMKERILAGISGAGSTPAEAIAAKPPPAAGGAIPYPSQAALGPMQGPEAMIGPQGPGPQPSGPQDMDDDLKAALGIADPTADLRGGGGPGLGPDLPAEFSIGSPQRISPVDQERQLAKAKALRGGGGQTPVQPPPGEMPGVPSEPELGPSRDLGTLDPIRASVSQSHPPTQMALENLDPNTLYYDNATREYIQQIAPQVRQRLSYKAGNKLADEMGYETARYPGRLKGK